MIQPKNCFMFPSPRHPSFVLHLFKSTSRDFTPFSTAIIITKMFCFYYNVNSKTFMLDKLDCLPWPCSLKPLHYQTRKSARYAGLWTKDKWIQFLVDMIFKKYNKKGRVIFTGLLKFLFLFLEKKRLIPNMEIFSLHFL